MVVAVVRPAGGGGFSRSPSFSPEPVGDPVGATVKWFNAEKGYGFAEIADGSGDAFLHIAALQAVGRESVPPGATLSVHVGQGQKGRQITKVVSVDEFHGDGRSAPPPRGRPFRRWRRRLAAGGGYGDRGRGGGGGIGGGGGGLRWRRARGAVRRISVPRSR